MCVVMMETLKTAVCDTKYLCYGVAAGAVIGTSYLAYSYLCPLSGRRRRWDDTGLLQGPSDTVILFQLQRGPRAPSYSPFPIKLETHLRMAKIPYETNLENIKSPKGKTPWIAYNGEAVSDSQLCIEFLNAKRGVDLNKHLTPEQRAVAKSFQVMVDEHLYWTEMYFKWIHSQDLRENQEFFNLSAYRSNCRRRYMKTALWYQGVGRHSADDIQKMLMDDLTALSNYLGKKQYIMGELPCETDCSIFGMLAQCIWQQRDPVMCNLIQDKFPNLHHYCIRIKERFWPDWDDILPKKRTRTRIHSLMI